MKMVKLMTAVGAAALGLASISAKADSIVQLSIVVNPSTSSYDVYANIPTDSQGTSGLYSTGVNITSDGSIALNKPVNLLPSGSYTDQGSFATVPAGFTSVFNVQIAGGWQVAGGQGVTYSTDSSGATAPDGKPVDSLVKGFGNQPSGYIGDNTTLKYWNGKAPNTADLARIAHGTFTGTFGDIFVQSAKTNTGGTFDNSTLLLPAVLPTSGSNLQNHYATAVLGAVYTNPPTAAPVPASLFGGSMVLGVLGVLRKLRRS